MKPTRLVVFIFLAAILCGGVAARGEDAQAPVANPQALVVDPQPGVHPKLKLTLPEGWTGRVMPAARPGDSPVVSIRKMVGRIVAAEIDLRFAWAEEGKMGDDASMSGLLAIGNKKFPQGEKTPQVKFAGKSGHGVYSVFMGADSDADAEGEPPPIAGLPKCGAQGLFNAKGWMITFMLLTDGPKSAEFGQAVKFVQDGIEVEK